MTVLCLAGLQVENMIRGLIESFKEMLHETDWMSETTRRQALEKVTAQFS